MSETAIGYTRLSQTSDPSIKRQKRHIREMAEDHDYNLEEIINDGQRTTGFDDDRDGFKRLYRLVRDGEVDVILLNDKRRIARDYELTTEIIDYLRTNEILMHTYREGKVRVNSPTDAAFEIFKAANEHEAMQRYIEATREAIEERLENGWDHGCPPYGLEFDDNGHYWVPDPDEWDTVRTVYEMRFDGDEMASYTDIADETGLSNGGLANILDRAGTYARAADRTHEYTFEWG
ncbi:recombinase family protein [Natrinema sp. 1APR25-10V2]|uniref:recombinase family protein n=1 Tax=Natrinema sp. 1APR25-10V2 TaxID=2951081 RepID=UPI002873FF0F|nr:recombinase family protein [Natrinema sp. 1APR25-10V2]MDS0474340.1 recombinase family protein [Natrinema sp. 1APR25-10V2]